MCRLRHGFVPAVVCRWKQKHGDLIRELIKDPEAMKIFQDSVTSLHRLFYQRAYSCNCFLCIATVCGEEGCCGSSADGFCFCFAKYSSRCCNNCLCCLCGRRCRELFREDGLKCSQLVANLYQGAFPSAAHRRFSSVINLATHDWDALPMTVCLAQGWG